MSQVFLHLSFGDAQGAGELMARHRTVGQKINDVLTHGPLSRQHGKYGKHSCGENPDWRTRIHGKSSEVVRAYGALLVAQ